jgi:hypothetical protein
MQSGGSGEKQRSSEYPEREELPPTLFDAST